MTFWRPDYPKDYASLETLNMTENDRINERDQAFIAGGIMGWLVGFACGIGFSIWMIAH